MYALVALRFFHWLSRFPIHIQTFHVLPAGVTDTFLHKEYSSFLNKESYLPTVSFLNVKKTSVRIGKL
jgi:hypothetical protein